MKDEKDLAAKFVRIAGVAQDARRRLRGEMTALNEIAKHYGGENWNTGGNIYVAVIPLGPHDCMGVTGEVICPTATARRPAWMKFSTIRRTTQARDVSRCWIEEEENMEHKVAPDVLVRNEGIVFCPLTSEAKEWIDEHVQPDAQWFGNPDRRAQVRVGLGQGMKDPGPSDGVRRGENDNQ